MVGEIIQMQEVEYYILFLICGFSKSVLESKMVSLRLRKVHGENIEGGHIKRSKIWLVRNDLYHYLV